MSRAGEAAVRRARLLQSAIGLVEDLQVTGPPAALPHTDDYSPDFQVCLPYRGVFVWHVGRDDIVADPNRCCSSAATRRSGSAVRRMAATPS